MTAVATEERKPVLALLQRMVDVKREEVRAMLMAFAYFFFVMSGYFVLRPIRDAMAAAGGVSQLPWLFMGTLSATLVFQPVFGTLVSKFPARRFIPITYNIFISNILIFYLLMRFAAPGESSATDVWVGRSFFVWTSMFNLFVPSVFWCFMADVFRSEQAKRLFGFIGVGGTLGSIVGSAVTAALASKIGAVNLLLVSAVLIELGVLVVMRFPVVRVTEQPTEREQSADAMEGDSAPIGGSVWAGISRIAQSPYLMAVCGFLVLFTIGSTVLYFVQTDIVGREFTDRASRTAVLAKLELIVQILTVVTQMFLTGRVIRWFGLAATLAILPMVSIAGFGALGLAPTFVTLAVFTVIRRASNFALTNPAMEVLFTVVDREDKYKAKSFIETFVYRGGDQIGAWFFAGLSALGMTLASISFVAVPLAGFWLMLGLWLGRRHAVLAGERSPETTTSTTPVPAT